MSRTLERKRQQQFTGIVDGILKQREKEKAPLIQPSEDEIRNGWTAETLTAYIISMEASSAARIDPHGPARHTPARRARKYSPFRHWRRRAHAKSTKS